MRVAAILWCSSIGGLQVYLFRRIRDDLVKNHMEGPKGFRSLLAGWVVSGFVTIVEDEIRFWNGSKIYLCHCKDEKDIYKYQGAEIHVLLIDELTHFTESMYRFLRNRVRMVGITLAQQFQGMFPRILCGANPGNIGHLWVKRTFVDGVEDLALRRAPQSEGGMLRQFIRAMLEDNPSMAMDDPGYDARLHGLGSKQLVKAMRFGDWDVVEGAFFDNWDAQRHILRPFPIPASWPRFRSGDWGSAKPFSFGWWAITSEAHPAANRDGHSLIIPRGALVRYREYYGAEKDEGGASIPDKGLKMNAEDAGREIARREVASSGNGSSGREKIGYGVLDPACFAQHGGPTIAEMLAKGGAGFGPADNTRVAQRGALSGWDQMRRRLDGDADGQAMIYCFSTCVDSIRTIPVLQHDPDRPEDLNTDMEDHTADEWRYACMSRPWLGEPKREKPKNFTYVADQKTGTVSSTITMNEIIRRMERKAKRGL